MVIMMPPGRGVGYDRCEASTTRCESAAAAATLLLPSVVIRRSGGKLDLLSSPDVSTCSSMFSGIECSAGIDLSSVVAVLRDVRVWTACKLRMAECE
jgi:hypothetical protein